MGCDIHFNVEARDAYGEWRAVPRPLRRCSCTGYDWQDEPAKPPRPDCSYCQGSGLATEDFYEGRNYDLFGVLAGVRSRWVEPISELCGIPADLSEDWKGHAYDDHEDPHDKGFEIYSRDPIRYNQGDHSWSWLTVRELLEWNWWTPYSSEPDEPKTATEACGEFVRVLQEELLPLGHPDDVRIVFSFDS